jgi:hypothetical protein
MGEDCMQASRIRQRWYRYERPPITIGTFKKYSVMVTLLLPVNLSYLPED